MPYEGRICEVFRNKTGVTISSNGQDRYRFIPWVIILAAVAAYANSFSGVFLFDDYGSIRNNAYISSLWPVVLKSRFVVDLTFRLNYLAGEFNVADYHLVNLIIHILSALVLYGLIRRTLLLPALSARYGSHSGLIAGFAAILWAVHPLQTESVTYICQRYESLMGLFFLLSVYCFARAFDSQHKRFWYNSSIAACALGMGSKEGMFAAPIAVILYDYTFFASSFRSLLKENMRYYLAMFCTWGILAVFFLFDVTESMKSGRLFAMLPHISPWQYLVTQFSVIVHYMKLTVLPVGLCLDYNWPLSQNIAGVLPQAMFIGSLLAATVWALIRRSPLGFAGAWFFLTLAPNSSIFPIADPAFEHRMYLPLASAAVIAVVCGYQAVSVLLSSLRQGAWLRNGVFIIITSLVAAFFICLTVRRNNDYRSEEAMWRDVVSKREDNLRARNDLAIALAGRGKTSEAFEQYSEIIRRIPLDLRRRLDSGMAPVVGGFVNNSFEYNYFKAHANMGLMLFKEMNDRNGAIEHYLSALMIAPFHVEVREKLKVVLESSGVPEKNLAGEIERLLAERKRSREVQ